MDSMLTVRRPFENGEVALSFYDTGRRQEYVFAALARAGALSAGETRRAPVWYESCVMRILNGVARTPIPG